MAQRVNIVLTDDIDENIGADETVTFALDGKSYEIDLSTANAARLRAAVEEFRAKARPLGGRAAAKPTRKRAASGNATDIRAWAVAQGMAVSSRGRVPAEIRTAYEAAH
jgi:Lsr2